MKSKLLFISCLGAVAAVSSYFVTRDKVVEVVPSEQPIPVAPTSTAKPAAIEESQDPFKLVSWHQLPTEKLWLSPDGKESAEWSQRLKQADVEIRLSQMLLMPNGIQIDFIEAILEELPGRLNQLFSDKALSGARDMIDHTHALLDQILALLEGRNLEHYADLETVPPAAAWLRNHIIVMQRDLPSFFERIQTPILLVTLVKGETELKDRYCRLVATAANHFKFESGLKEFEALYEEVRNTPPPFTVEIKEKYEAK